MNNFEESNMVQNIKYQNLNLSQRNLSNNNSKLFSLPPNNNLQQITFPMFEAQLCEYLYKYLQLLQFHKNSQWLNLYFQSIK